MDGIVLIDKPRGWTSFDVVGRVRRLITNSPYNSTRRKRFPVGHTGTLDPLATGLLVILVGTYTKQAQTLLKLDKTYEVTLTLGATSATGDAEGQLTAISSQQPTNEAVQAAVAQFVGEQQQTPPAFSAIKVNGKRAYELARAGKEVVLTPRIVHVYAISEVRYRYPEVHFTASVSSGTYIRSLVEDIGAVLGTGAYMSALCRTRVGDYSIAQAVPADTLDIDVLAAHITT